MLLQKSKDRLRSRIITFFALHFVIAPFFFLNTVGHSFADTLNNQEEPVLGPEAPGSPDENSEEEFGEEEIPSGETTYVEPQGNAQPMVMPEDQEKAKALEKTLVEERKKLEIETKPVSSETGPEAVSSQYEQKAIRLDSGTDSKELMRIQKLEMKHYGMSLADLSSQWQAFREKAQKTQEPLNYKSLSGQEKKLVKSMVRVERAVEQDKLILMDPGYFKQEINPNTVLAQENFLIDRSKSLNEVVVRSLEVAVPIRFMKTKENSSKWKARKAFRDLISEFKVELTDKHGSLAGSLATGRSFVSRSHKWIFKQPVFHGGHLWNTFREQAALHKASREELDKTRAKLVLDVADAYLKYARAQSLYSIKSELTARAETLRHQNEERKKIGAVSEIEYLNTDSLIGEIRADLETANQELALAQSDLLKFINIPDGEKIETESIDVLKNNIVIDQGEGVQLSVLPGPEESSVINRELDDLIHLAYQNRPDLRFEEFKMMASRYKLKGTMGKFLPQLDLILETGELSEAFKNVAGNDPPFNHEFKFGIETSQNVAGNTVKYAADTDQKAPSVTAFQGGGNTRTHQHKFTFALLDGLQQMVDVKEARVQMMEQMVQLQEKENEAIKDVKESYYGFHKALIKLDSAVKKLAHKERVAKLKLYQLEKNQIQVSEYLQAEKDRIDAKGQYADAVSEYYKSRIALNRAIGEPDLLKVEGLPFSRKERGKV